MAGNIHITYCTMDAICQNLSILNYAFHPIDKHTISIIFN